MGMLLPLPAAPTLLIADYSPRYWYHECHSADVESIPGIVSDNLHAGKPASQEGLQGLRLSCRLGRLTPRGCGPRASACGECSAPGGRPLWTNAWQLTPSSAPQHPSCTPT